MDRIVWARFKGYLEVREVRHMTVNKGQLGLEREVP